MSAWSDSFLEVCYRARCYALAWDEAHYSGVWRNANANAELAKAKAKLELEMAAYKVAAANGVKRGA